MKTKNLCTKRAALLAIGCGVVAAFGNALHNDFASGAALGLAICFIFMSAAGRSKCVSQEESPKK